MATAMTTFRHEDKVALSRTQDDWSTRMRYHKDTGTVVHEYLRRGRRVGSLRGSVFTPTTKLPVRGRGGEFGKPIFRVVDANVADLNDEEKQRLLDAAMYQHGGGLVSDEPPLHGADWLSVLKAQPNYTFDTTSNYAPVSGYHAVYHPK